MDPQHEKSIKILFCSFILIELILYASLINAGIDEAAHSAYITSLAASNFKTLGDTASSNYASEPFLYYIISALIFKIVNNLLILKLIWAFLIFISVLVIFKSIDLFTDDKLIRLIAYSAIVFHPTFALNSSRISNENFLVFFSSIMFYLFIKYLPEKLNLKKEILLGTTLGLGILSKQQMLGFIPLLFFYFIFRSANSRNFKCELKSFFLILFICAFLSSFYYGFNYVHYNNPFPQKYLDPSLKDEFTLTNKIIKMIQFPLNFPILSQTQNNFIHHYGNLGVAQIYINKLFYQIFFIFLAIAISGTALFLIIKFIRAKNIAKCDLIISLITISSIILILTITLAIFVYKNPAYRIKGYTLDNLRSFFFFIFLAVIFLGFMLKLITNLVQRKNLSYQEFIIILIVMLSIINILGINYESYDYRTKGYFIDIIRSGLFNHLMTAEAILFGLGIASIFKNKMMKKVIAISFILFIIFANLSVMFYYYIPYYIFGVTFY